MRAPVYRNIESQNTLLGLTFPVEVLAVMSIFWAAIILAPPGIALLVTAASYSAIRILGYRRAPLFLQHVVAIQVRRFLAGGTLSAAAQGPAPRFPFAPYLSRDVPPKP